MLFTSFRQSVSESGQKISRLDRWLRDPTKANLLLYIIIGFLSYEKGPTAGEFLYTATKFKNAGGDVPRRDNTSMVVILHVA